jgi:hypothetical protein
MQIKQKKKSQKELSIWDFAKSVLNPMMMFNVQNQNWLCLIDEQELYSMFR